MILDSGDGSVVIVVIMMVVAVMNMMILMMVRMTHGNGHGNCYDGDFDNGRVVILIMVVWWFW